MQDNMSIPSILTSPQVITRRDAQNEDVEIGVVGGVDVAHLTFHTGDWKLCLVTELQ